MVATISRTELKVKIDRGDKFLLVETLPTAAYHHAHLPGAINLAPNQVKQLAPTLLPAEIVVCCARST
jgi:rhodanese-related sulfurtransferase